MLKKLFIILLSIPLICPAVPAKTITLKNPDINALKDYCMVIERPEFKQADSELYPALRDHRTGELLASQLDDLDGDGHWDEMAFLVNLAGKEKVVANIEWVTKDKYPVFQVRTNIYFGISRDRNGEFTEVSSEVIPPKYESGTPYQYQFEGVGWENDKIAFRTYCDMRNGKDIFGKTGESMVLPYVGKEENYHEIGDWGMDVLKVGSSLGIGAIAAIDDGKLVRLSDTEYHDFKIITEGPVRSIFELGFKGWNVNGKELNATETITITAGRNGFKNRVKISGNDLPDRLVSGLSMVGNDGMPQMIDLDHSHGITIAGINDIDDKFLGMAVLIDKNRKFDAEVSDKTADVYDTSTNEYKSTKYHAIITDTYYMSTSGAEAEFVVNSMWGGRYPSLKSKEDYFTMLKDDALNYFVKLKVKVK